MGRAIFTVDSYEATVYAVKSGRGDREFAMWCYSDILEIRGFRYRYQVFLDAPNSAGSGSLIYQRRARGQVDRTIFGVVNLSGAQIDRIYRLVSTEHPVRIRMDYDGNDLLSGDDFSAFRNVSDAQVFTGREPAGEGEGRTLEFPE
ncbi:MAG: hypothetical protein AAGD13_09370 [Pseudomonadota bacterium]